MHRYISEEAAALTLLLTKFLWKYEKNHTRHTMQWTRTNWSISMWATLNTCQAHGHEITHKGVFRFWKVTCWQTACQQNVFFFLGTDLAILTRFWFMARILFFFFHFPFLFLLKKKKGIGRTLKWSLMFIYGSTGTQTIDTTAGQLNCPQLLTSAEAREVIHNYNLFKGKNPQTKLQVVRVRRFRPSPIHHIPEANINQSSWITWSSLYFEIVHVQILEMYSMHWNIQYIMHAALSNLQCRMTVVANHV